VLVSVDKVGWLEAETVERISRAIPLDHERMIREHTKYGEVEQP
jgi:hypothetical protein